jgi:hypothetical protein
MVDGTDDETDDETNGWMESFISSTTSFIICKYSKQYLALEKLYQVQSAGLGGM